MHAAVDSPLRGPRGIDFGKDVIPHLLVDPSIMGGVIVHVGDTVLDGSVKKRLMSLKKRMLAGA